MKLKDLLIVDDEKRFADMLAKRLCLRGFHSDVCHNGKQAIELARRKRFFAILLDLHLPDIYGSEVLKELRLTSATTPVIIITGHGTEKDRQSCLQQGAYAFVHKPLGIDKLISIFAQIEKASP